MKLTTIKKWFFALILVLAIPTQASIITIGFSGSIDENYFDVPVDTIVYGSASYDTDATPVFVISSNAFAAFDISFTMFGETITNHFGYIKVTDTVLSLQSGPSLIGGGSTDFSDSINGIEVRGVGFTISGDFSQDILPTDTGKIYGQGGEFFVNRSQGALFDVDSPDLLQIPQSANDVVAASSPATLSLFLLGLGLIFSTRSRFSRD